VKESLVVDLGKVSDIEGLAEKHDVAPWTRLMQYDFVLVDEDEVRKLRDEKAREAIEKQGGKGMRVVNGVLP
jgi:hypothetical protein